MKFKLKLLICENCGCGFHSKNNRACFCEKPECQEARKEKKRVYSKLRGRRLYKKRPKKEKPLIEDKALKALKMRQIEREAEETRYLQLFVGCTVARKDTGIILGEVVGVDREFLCVRKETSMQEAQLYLPEHLDLKNANAVKLSRHR